MVTPDRHFSNSNREYAGTWKDDRLVARLSSVQSLDDYDVARLGDIQDVPIGLRPAAREINDKLFRLPHAGGWILLESVAISTLREIGCQS